MDCSYLRRKTKVPGLQIIWLCCPSKPRIEAEAYQWVVQVVQCRRAPSGQRAPGGHRVFLLSECSQINLSKLHHVVQLMQSQCASSHLLYVLLLFAEAEI